MNALTALPRITARSAGLRKPSAQREAPKMQPNGTNPATLMKASSPKPRDPKTPRPVKCPPDWIQHGLLKNEVVGRNEKTILRANPVVNDEAGVLVEQIEGNTGVTRIDGSLGRIGPTCMMALDCHHLGGSSPRLQATASASSAAQSAGEMGEYRRGAHTVYEIRLHLVWTTKYRRAVLEASRGGGDAREGSYPGTVWDARRQDHERTRIERPRASTGINTAAGGGEQTDAMAEGEDGIQSDVGVSPHQKARLGQHMWARGYFCCSTGNVTDEIIADYIAHQNDNRDDDFKVDG